MTVTFPEGLDAAGKGSLFVTSTIADTAAPKLTEFASPTGFTIHCDIVAWTPTLDHPRIQKPRYCLAQSVEAFGRKTWTLDPITVVYDPQTPDDPNYQAYLKLVEGSSFYFFDRRGDDSTAALATGDIGDLYPITVGGRDRVAISDQDGSELQTRIFLAISGPVVQDVAIVAGA